MLSEAEIADIRARAPLASLAAEFGANLRRRGGRLVGPCPLCGGDKCNQRFEILNPGGADETFVCAVCQQGGDAIKLAQLHWGLGFREAVERLGGARRIDHAEAARREREIADKRAVREAEAAKYREKERRRCVTIWRGSLPASGSPVEAYLIARAIRDVAHMRVRFAPAQPYFDGERELLPDEAAARGEPWRAGAKIPRLIYTGAAMLAPIMGADGAFFQGLHITWIDATRPGKKIELVDPETGDELPAKKMRGHKSGGYLDVFPGGDARRVYLGEGIESVGSVREAKWDGACYRVAGDLGNLAGRSVARLPHPFLRDKAGRPRRVPGPEPDLESEACPIPDACVDLMLLKDGDSDPFTTEQAMIRAAFRHQRRGRRIAIADPGDGFDFNDLARGAAA